MPSDDIIAPCFLFAPCYMSGVFLAAQVLTCVCLCVCTVQTEANVHTGLPSYLLACSDTL